MTANLPFLARYLKLPPDVSLESGDRRGTTSNEIQRPTNPMQDRTSPPLPQPGTTFTRVERETTDDN